MEAARAAWAAQWAPAMLCALCSPDNNLSHNVAVYALPLLLQVRECFHSCADCARRCGAYCLQSAPFLNAIALQRSFLQVEAAAMGILLERLQETMSAGGPEAEEAVSLAGMIDQGSALV